MASPVTHAGSPLYPNLYVSPTWGVTHGDGCRRATDWQWQLQFTAEETYLSQAGSLKSRDTVCVHFPFARDQMKSVTPNYVPVAQAVKVDGQRMAQFTQTLINEDGRFGLGHWSRLSIIYKGIWVGWLIFLPYCSHILCVEIKLNVRFHGITFSLQGKPCIVRCWFQCK